MLASLFFITEISGQTDWSKEELMGKFDPSTHSGFVRVEPTHASREGMWLRKETMDAFIRMKQSADSAGIRLTILSATRNFNHQKSIWEKKWNLPRYRGWKEADRAKDILRYSSMPGTSRHHWGTDIDINSLEPAYFQSGAGKKVYDWLAQNAVRFGFCQTYTSSESGRTGYSEEAWHWSYFPLSGPFLESYNRIIRYEDLTGFSGSASAAEIGIIENYVNGIECAGSR